MLSITFAILILFPSFNKSSNIDGVIPLLVSFPLKNVFESKSTGFSPIFTNSSFNLAMSSANKSDGKLEASLLNNPKNKDKSSSFSYITIFPSLHALPTNESDVAYKTLLLKSLVSLYLWINAFKNLFKFSDTIVDISNSRFLTCLLYTKSF